ncbi:MAG: carbon monoxide dehydrogenase subunit G [Candidatus Puniceispirillum sp.]
MKLELGGEETINTSPDSLWESVIDPVVLQRAIPGCISMVETEPGHYVMTLELKVAAVGGSFEGSVALSDMDPPRACVITVSGSGTLGTGTGSATVTISETDDGNAKIAYQASGEVGGLVAGVGQRILMGVAKHLVRQFFAALKKEFAAA